MERKIHYGAFSAGVNGKTSCCCQAEFRMEYLETDLETFSFDRPGGLG